MSLFVMLLSFTQSVSHHTALSFTWQPIFEPLQVTASSANAEGCSEVHDQRVTLFVRCRLYPYYVTGDMISDWGSHTRNGETVSWDAARSMQVQDPDIRQRHHDWGQQGASASFGGGGGYGGGGTGGSW